MHVEDRRHLGRGYRVRYRGPDHRERSKSFRLKGDADRFAVMIESSKLGGEWVDPKLGKTSFDEWASRWMSTTVGLKPKTRQGYESLLRAHLLPAFGKVPLARIQPVEVREWVARLSAKGLSSSRLRQAHQLLSMILKAAVESGYLARTPCVGIKIPRASKREQVILQPDQIDFHLERNVLDEPDALVFTSAEGAPLRYNNFRRRVWSKVLRKLDGQLPKGLSLHHLCHTCASLLIREGASVKAVQEQLGHSSATVTLNVYAHLFDDDLDRLFERVDAIYMHSHAARSRPERGPALVDAPDKRAGNAV